MCMQVIVWGGHRVVTCVALPPPMRLLSNLKMTAQPAFIGVFAAMIPISLVVYLGYVFVTSHLVRGASLLHSHSE